MRQRLCTLLVYRALSDRTPTQQHFKLDNERVAATRRVQFAQLETALLLRLKQELTGGGNNNIDTTALNVEEREFLTFVEKKSGHARAAGDGGGALVDYLERDVAVPAAALVKLRTAQRALLAQTKKADANKTTLLPPTTARLLAETERTILSEAECAGGDASECDGK